MKALSVIYGVIYFIVGIISWFLFFRSLIAPPIHEWMHGLYFGFGVFSIGGFLIYLKSIEDND